MKSIKKFAGNMIVSLGLQPAIVVLCSHAAHAATLGGLAQSASSDLVSFGGLIEIGAYITGAVFVVAALLKFAQLANQPGAPKGPALILFVIGVLLLGFGFLVTAASGTFGTTSTGLGRLNIGQ